MSDDKWDYDTTIKFIRLVHARPVIWQKNLQEFIRQYDKDAAIADVAARLHTNPTRIKNKLRQMRESCYQEEIRMQTFNDHTPRWNFFHQFRFILKAEYADECMKREIDEPVDAEPNDIDEIFWVGNINDKQAFYDESDGTETAAIDEFSILGENIANELRKLEKHDNLQAKLKNEITLAMLEAIENVAKQKIKN